MVIENKKIEELQSKISIKRQSIRKETSELAILSQRLEDIKLLPRIVEVPSSRSREVPDPMDSTKTIKVPVKATEKVFDIPPKNQLFDKAITEEERQKVYDDVTVKFVP